MDSDSGAIEPLLEGLANQSPTYWTWTICNSSPAVAALLSRVLHPAGEDPPVVSFDDGAHVGGGLEGDF